MPSFGQNLDERRATAVEEVNSACGAVRGQFVTDLPGQELVYMKKEAEAARYLIDPLPNPANYPFIMREVGSTAPTAYEVAQVYANLAAQWDYVGSQLEELRIGSITAIELAVSARDIVAVLEEFRTNYGTFVASL